MNVIKTEKIRTVATVSMIRLDDGIRLVYEFSADPGYMHDADGYTSLFGSATRLENISDAAVVPEKYAEMRFRQACATV